jgi:hypothetical protein
MNCPGQTTGHWSPDALACQASAMEHSRMCRLRGQLPLFRVADSSNHLGLRGLLAGVDP